MNYIGVKKVKCGGVHNMSNISRNAGAILRGDKKNTEKKTDEMYLNEPIFEHLFSTPEEEKKFLATFEYSEHKLKFYGIDAAPNAVVDEAIASHYKEKFNKPIYEGNLWLITDRYITVLESKPPMTVSQPELEDIQSLQRELENIEQAGSLKAEIFKAMRQTKENEAKETKKIYATIKEKEEYINRIEKELLKYRKRSQHLQHKIIKSKKYEGKGQLLEKIYNKIGKLKEYLVEKIGKKGETSKTCYDLSNVHRGTKNAELKPVPLAEIVK